MLCRIFLLNSISICRTQHNCFLFMYRMGETQQLLQHRYVTNPIVIFSLKINLNMAKTAFRELKDVFLFKHAYLNFVIFLIHSESKVPNLWVTQILWKAKHFPLGLCLSSTHLYWRNKQGIKQPWIKHKRRKPLPSTDTKSNTQWLLPKSLFH